MAEDIEEGAHGRAFACTCHTTVRYVVAIEVNGATPRTWIQVHTEPCSDCCAAIPMPTDVWNTIAYQSFNPWRGSAMAN